MDPKKTLKDLIKKIETKQFREGEAKGLIEQIQAEQTKALKPVLEGMATEMSDAVQKAINEGFANVQVNVPETKAPEISVDVSGIEDALRALEIPRPTITVQAPTVNVPEQKAPIVNMPEIMKILGSVELSGVDKKNPLPVILMGLDGKPMTFSFGGGYGGGGKTDFFTIKDLQNSSGGSLIDNDGFLKVTGSFSTTPFGTYFASDAALSVNVIQAVSFETKQLSGAVDSVSIVESITLDVKQLSGSIDSVYISGVAQSFFAEVTNPDGRIKVELPTGSSGLTDTELRASAVPVTQVSGAGFSVSVTDVFGSTGANVINPDGRIKVELPTGSSSLTDTELRASSVPVSQVSGNIDSVNVVGFTASVATILSDPANVPYNDSNPFPVYAYNKQVSGASDSVNVIGFSASVAVVNLDRDGNPSAGWPVYPVATGNNETNANVLRMIMMSDVVNSVNIMAQGVTLDVRQLSGAGFSVNVVNQPAAIDVKQVSGSSDSVLVTGAVDSFFAYEVMTTNKTAKSDGADIRPKADDLGRQIMRPIQVRDLIATAYVAVTNGTETTLLAAGGAGVFHDLLMITATNNSTAAVQVDIRAVTGGNIVHTMYLPATTGPVGFSPSIPWPQDAPNNNWTVDLPDVTGTTVYFTALFSKEI